MFLIIFGPLFALTILVMGPLLVGHEVYSDLVREWDYHARYGDTWKQHFREDLRISVEETNQRIMVGIGGLIVIGGLAYLVYRQIAPKRAGMNKSHRRRRSSTCLPM